MDAGLRHLHQLGQLKHPAHNITRRHIRPQQHIKSFPWRWQPIRQLMCIGRHIRLYVHGERSIRRILVEACRAISNGISVDLVVNQKVVCCVVHCYAPERLAWNRTPYAPRELYRIPCIFRTAERPVFRVVVPRKIHGLLGNVCGEILVGHDSTHEEIDAIRPHVMYVPPSVVGFCKMAAQEVCRVNERIPRSAGEREGERILRGEHRSIESSGNSQSNRAEKGKEECIRCRRSISFDVLADQFEKGKSLGRCWVRSKECIRLAPRAIGGIRRRDEELILKLPYGFQISGIIQIYERSPHDPHVRSGASNDGHRRRIECIAVDCEPLLISCVVCCQEVLAGGRSRCSCSDIRKVIRVKIEQFKHIVPVGRVGCGDRETHRPRVEINPRL
eukprot:Opistho-2@71377